MAETYIVRRGTVHVPTEETISATSATISIRAGQVWITASSAASIYLGAPTAGVEDGYELEIHSTTNVAHTVYQTSPLFNSGYGTVTFVTDYGANFRVRAHNGTWLYTPGSGVTLA